jgi:hypothetical protein
MNDGAAASLSGSPAVHSPRHAACPHLQVVTNLSLHTREELGDIADGMKHSPCIARRWLIPVGVRPDAGLVWPTLAVNSIWVQQSGRRTSLPEPPRGGIRVPPARRGAHGNAPTYATVRACSRSASVSSGTSWPLCATQVMPQGAAAGTVSASRTPVGSPLPPGRKGSRSWCGEPGSSRDESGRSQPRRSCSGAWSSASPERRSIPTPGGSFAPGT